MKKRLLALALCLVMVTSLLPITAAAETVNKIVITGDQFGENINGYGLSSAKLSVTVDGQPDAKGFRVHSDRLYQDQECTMLVQNDPVEDKTYFLKCQISVPNSLFSFTQQTEYVLKVNGYSTPLYSSEKQPMSDYLDIIFQVTKDHDWKFTVSENHDKLTAECQNQGCPTKEVSVSLEADSVTLPNSPFEAAQLVGWNDFQAATGAEKTDIVYKRNGVEVSDGSTPKAGNYQAWVMIKNLRGPVYQDGVAALADNQDSSGNTAELFVQYTAVDPAVTAQTGDNRPIELMMISVLVFSALAAAAFVVDSKRRSQQ